MYAREMVDIFHGATVLCGVVHVPVACDELCFVNAKLDWVYCTLSLNSQIKTA